MSHVSKFVSAAQGCGGQGGLSVGAAGRRTRRFVCKPLVLALVWAFCSTAHAQTFEGCHHAAGDAAALAASAPVADGAALPAGATRIRADKIAGQTGVRALAEGDVVVERGNEVLQAQRIDYDQPDDTVTAEGGFTLTRGDGAQVRGDALQYDLGKGGGRVRDAEFEAEHEGRRLQGSGAELVLHDPQRTSAKQVRFNTCGRGDNPWYVEAAELQTDRSRNIGSVKHAKLVFKGVPVLYAPWADFPLNGGRKSGFLVPVAKIGSNGTELEVPYYFNVAPNYDATLALGGISARGATARGEMRYLMPEYHGQVQARYMPHDRRSPHKNRYELRWQHDHRITPQLQAGIRLHQVSDDDYYRDFYGRNEVAENVQLERQAWLAFEGSAAGGALHAKAEARQYQTLSDAQGRKDKPYALLPRLSLHWQKQGLGNIKTAVYAQFARFEQRQKQDGSRAVLYPQISRDFHTQWWYVRPKAGLHLTHYRLDRFGGTPARKVARILPVANVDAGMNFERRTRLFGQNFLQTLEPRLFYNYIPKKPQNHLPNFDASENSFSYAQLFRENLYSGNDRINNSNSLSFGLQTRLFEAQSGAERFRAGIGQKFYFDADDVLPDDHVARRPRSKSDIAAFAGGNIARNWHADTRLHYNQTVRALEHADAGVRYQPAAGKVISFRYKYGRKEETHPVGYGRLRQLDAAFQ
nr:LPS-assembly protein LptD [Conchiformibius kuhniae]